MRQLASTAVLSMALAAFSLAVHPQIALGQGYQLGLKVPDLATLKDQIQAQAAKVAELKPLDALAQQALVPGTRASLPEMLMRARLPSASAPSFDWTPLIPNWPVKNQTSCGSCFVFAAVGAFEASYFIRNGERISASEQCLLDRTLPFEDCKAGGWSADPLTQLMTLGDAGAANYPYVAAKHSPQLNAPMSYRALVWGFVGSSLSPSIAEIKQALLDHGPLAFPVWADEPSSPRQQLHPALNNKSNHEVTLVGWDDSRRAWKVRNSWGSGWSEGTDGYGTVAYAPDGQGSCVLWVEALCDRYQLPAAAQRVVDAGRAMLGDASLRTVQTLNNLALGKFDEDILGYHLKLENGSASSDSQKTTLSGSVSVWPVNNPGTRLTFDNATLTVKRSGGTATEFGGSGGLKASVAGQQIVMGDAATVACTANGQLSGNGHLQAQNHRFTIAYKLAAGSGLAADGTWNGGDAGWQDLPGISGIEYHVQNPQLAVALRNAAITVTLCCSKVEVRTKGRNAVNNQPWAEAQINPPCVSVGVDANVNLPLPSLPQPGDLNFDARKACYALCPPAPIGDKPKDYGDPVTHKAAQAWDAGWQAHNDGIHLCDSKFPSPPSLPHLPASITIQVQVVIR